MQSFEMPINGLHPFFSVNRKKNLEVGGIHHGCLLNMSKNVGIYIVFVRRKKLSLFKHKP